MPTPGIQFALLHSIGSASLLFVLLRVIKEMKLEGKDMPQFVSPGRSFKWGIFFLTLTWVFTAFYILCLVEFPDGHIYVDNFLWTIGAIGVVYSSIGIFALLIKGELATFLEH